MKNIENCILKQDIHGKIEKINGTNNYYVSSTGEVYHLIDDELFYKMKPYLNKKGYYYVTLQSIERKHKSFRVNRLVAEYFIPNPKNYPIVGHKNNIKTDNRIENLYWTTYSENTQKAVNDKLLVNDIGYEDSQSHPVIVYDENMTEIDRIGSVSLCAKKYKVSKSTVSRHCKGEIKSKTRCGFYFRYDNSNDNNR